MKPNQAEDRAESGIELPQARCADIRKLSVLYKAPNSPLGSQDRILAGFRWISGFWCVACDLLIFAQLRTVDITQWHLPTNSWLWAVSAIGWFGYLGSTVC